MPGYSIMARIEKALGIQGAMPDVKLWVFVLITSFIGVGLLFPMGIAYGTLAGRGALVAFGILTSIICVGVLYVVQRIYWQTAVPRKGLLLGVAGLSYALLVWLFAGLYMLISRLGDTKAFYFTVNSRYGTLDVVSAVYFSVATIATVGYGDIVPVTPLARWAVIAEIIVGIAYTIYIFSALVTLLLSQELKRNQLPLDPPKRE